MVFYFTGTGNSLYIAKQLDENAVSIPHAGGRMAASDCGAPGKVRRLRRLRKGLSLG